MPSTSKKQQKFMGAQLASQRQSGSNSTGMGEQQLREFAGQRVTKAKHQKDGRSLIDVEFHVKRPEEGSIEIHGHYAKPGELCHDAQANHEQLSSWKARDSHNLKSYDAKVMFVGPDSDFRTEEINPHHYGRDYEPSPWEDYFTTGKKAEELGIRLREEYRYETEAMPGAVADEGLPSSLAYGAVSYKSIKTDRPDNRSFDSQETFRRQHDEDVDDAPDNGPKVKAYRHR